VITLDPKFAVALAPVAVEHRAAIETLRGAKTKAHDLAMEALRSDLPEALALGEWFRLTENYVRLKELSIAAQQSRMIRLRATGALYRRQGRREARRFRRAQG
jgi:hypothetical protein